MKNMFKKVTSAVIAAIILISCLNIISTAAVSTIISLSKKNLSKGEELTVTVTFNATEDMYGVQCNVNYDASILQFNPSGPVSGGAGVLHIVGSPAGVSKESYSISFTAIAAGTSNISVSDCLYVGENETPFTGASASVSVADETKAGDATLSSLKVSNGTLSPAFSAKKTSYTVSVPFNITECKIYATPTDQESKVDVSGNANLEVGKNTRVVTVTAPDGTQKAYTIAITRLAETQSKPEENPEEKPGETEGTNPLEVTVDGKKGTIVSDISGITLLSGFTASTADYNGNAVGIAVDINQKYKIYYIKLENEEQPKLYTYNSEGKTFTKLKYITIGENSYIFANLESGLTAPDGFYESAAQINGENVKCFAFENEKMTNFYIIYCYRNGKYDYYRYDTTENVMQRSPDFVPIEAEKADTDLQENANLIQKFKNLNTSGKVIVVCIIIVIAAVTALLVLLILKLVNNRSNSEFISEFDDYESTFDDISINDTFTIENDEVQNEDTESNSEDTVNKL